MTPFALRPSSATIGRCRGPVIGALAIGLTLTGVQVASTASAATPWFGTALTSDLDNGAGPGPAPRGAAGADFNSDGLPDLVSASQFGNGEVLLSLGTGGGAFAAGTPIAGSGQTQGLDAGDVNGDGNADVVVMSTTQARVFLGDGDGNFALADTESLTLGGQVQPLIGDIDGDGDNDIVAPTFTAIQTLINAGDGSFTTGPTTQVTGAAVVSGIAIADVDGDQYSDLFAVDGFSGTTFALRGSATGAFAISGRTFATGFIPEDVAALDLDGDGFDDVATIGSFSFSIATSLTDGAGGFRSRIPSKVQYSGPGPTSAAVGDFDQDGRDDLIVSALANPFAGTITVLAGDGTAKMRKVGTASTPAFPQNPVPADYDGDGDLDLAFVSPGSVSVLPNTVP